MKYILRTLWLIGFLPVFAFAGVVTALYSLVGYLLAVGYVFIKTGDIESANIPLPTVPAECTLGKYLSLLDKIK